MTSKPSDHSWSEAALFTKAVLYATEMERNDQNSWQYRLWASLSLELLARAALARRSPTLLAHASGAESWRNIYHGLGHEPTKKGFTPKSIGAVAVLEILGEIIPNFTKELRVSCSEQCRCRNAELHSGEMTYAGNQTSAWLPQFYKSCSVFLSFLGKGLDEFFGKLELAEKMIASLNEEAAKSVSQDIEKHREEWRKTEEQFRRTAIEKAAIWATRNAGHRTKCPSCESPALIRGSGHGSVSTEISNETIVQKQLMLPSAFECIACGLEISGFSKLLACGLGDEFNSTTTFSPEEFFGLYTEQDLEEARMNADHPEPEEDFNEY